MDSQWDAQSIRSKVAYGVYREQLSIHYDII